MKVSCAWTLSGSLGRTEILRMECVQTTHLPGLRLMGAPMQRSVETRERLAAAFASAGVRFPSRKIVLALPGKEKWSDLHDLPAALAILAGMKEISANRAAEVVACGRLHLTGELEGGGEIPAVPAALGRDFLFPRDFSSHFHEPVPGGGTVRNLREALDWLKGRRQTAEAFVRRERFEAREKPALLNGFPLVVRRAAILSAAGGHALLLLGPHGYGKTMLGRAMADLLPSPAPDEWREIAAISPGSPGGEDGQRPFRNPHSRISVTGLVGREESGSPGEWHLARHGVLFLDEILERPRSKTEPLRPLLESDDPGRPLFVAAANLCPCGRWGSGHGGCRCTPSQRGCYLSRLSGAMEERFDLRLRLTEPATPRSCPHRQDPRKMVLGARQRMVSRQGRLNSFLSGSESLEALPWDAAAKNLLESLTEGGSARAHASAARLALTVADLESAACVEERHVREALFFQGVQANCSERAVIDSGDRSRNFTAMP